MTFFETLEAHRGGLLRIKSELFWYGGRGWDGARGRICLLLDAAARSIAATATAATTPVAHAGGGFGIAAAAVLLLIDGCPHWVWVGQEDVELIT